MEHIIKKLRDIYGDAAFNTAAEEFMQDSRVQSYLLESGEMEFETNVAVRNLFLAGSDPQTRLEGDTIEWFYEKNKFILRKERIDGAVQAAREHTKRLKDNHRPTYH